jgi:predicted AAA+ superfamily ATPase
MKLITRVFNIPQESFFLFGPRGTGKSTWLKQNFPEAVWIDLLKPDILRTYSARPERLEEVVLGSKQKVIIIDEVQKIPELLSVVHSLIEQKLGRQFILTGSSARKLKRTGVNLLAGRAILRRLHPFMAVELGKDFDLKNALQFGLVPLIISSPNPVDVLNTYIDLYLREEVKAEGLVRNIGNFARFLEVISFSHGSILNINNIARECAVSRKLIDGYLSVLEDLLLCFSLPVFTKRAKRTTVSHPKFYYFDAGIFNNLRAQGPLDSSDEIAGMAMEGLVAQHLRAWNDYQGAPYSLYYWRTRHGVEVDFIIYGAKGFWAIEVKNSKQIYPKNVRSLTYFCNDYPEAIPLLLYRGSERLKIKNILCLPVEDFLKDLNPCKLLIP